MTSYTLRKGAAEKTKADVVVIGVVRTPKGLRAAAGGEGWRRPTAASSRRCCPRSASPASPARSPRCRPAAGSSPRC